jgi:four helix bundle protein
MASFRTLELAILFHEKVERTPVRGKLRDQLVRAATSVALNLSEGNSKPSVKEKKRFFLTAYASCQGCKTILRLARSKNLATVQMADHLAASL